ncbi:MAG: peptide chain release factor N(5)-glutamine methyltransferase [Bacilli bacterium]
MKIKEVLDQASAKLVEFKKNEIAAYELLRALLSLESYELYDQINEVVNKDIIERFEKQIDAHIHGVPLQQILGYSTFLGRDFIVNENVLIPRYETEELVENVLYHIDDYFKRYEQITIVDIGTGSGAIAITLDLEEARAKVYGSDISQSAIEVACSNNDKHHAHVEFFKGDLLVPLIKADIKADILVSNPPYIPNNEEIEASVKDYEPHLALFGGEEGLDFYIRILKDAKALIKDRALLAFEIGHDQKERIIKEVETYFPNSEYKVLDDVNGKNRMLFIYYNIDALDV